MTTTTSEQDRELTKREWAGSGGCCRVPMFSGFGCPDGFCGEEAFGPQWPERLLRFDRGFYGRTPFCMGPCCPRHGGPRENDPVLFQDRWTEEGRVMWCAVMPDFADLQASPAGFDGDPIIAVQKLRTALRNAGVKA